MRCISERDEKRRQSLISFMHDAGYTVKEFSKMMYLSYEYVRIMVKGYARVTDSVLGAIAFRFCIPVDVLLEGDYVRKNTQSDSERFEKIGLILKRSRKECGYSQMDVCEKLDVDLRKLQLQEDGKVHKGSRREMFLKLASLYMVDSRIWNDDSIRNQWVEGRV